MREFWKKGCENSKLLGILFHKTITTGVLDHAPKIHHTLMRSVSLMNVNVGVRVDVNPDSPEDLDNVLNQKHTTCSGKHPMNSHYKSRRHSKKSRPCLVHNFKHMFSVFKQHYMYFHMLFHSHVFPKKLKTAV